LSKYRMKTVATVAMVVILASMLGILITQNVALSTSNSELSKSNDELSESNDKLLAMLDNVTREWEAVKQNYTMLLSFFGPDPNPVIKTRLGIELLERVTVGDNYLWVTGEVENTENVTVYNVMLNFTLYTYRGIDNSRIVIGTMEPHQVVPIRTSIQTSLGKIINWTLDPVATYLS
jgi:hypothetical protein